MRKLQHLTLLTTCLIAPLACSQAQTPSTGDDLGALYRHLHTNPELSFKEYETSKRLASELDRLGFDVTTGIGHDWVKAKALRDQGEVFEGVGGYGVVGVFRNGDGPTVLLRTDTDGLPVPEMTGKPYASKVTSQIGWSGVTSPVMHACGHDIHMTTWVGAARNLIANKNDWSGTLVMIAQPAEELGLGAPAMLSDGLYERFPKPDVNLALHVNASLPSGTVAYTSGYALAAVDTVDITVHGSGGHGAYPHTTKDPVVIAAHIVTALQTLVSRNVNPQDPGVVTVGSFQAGAKHNIISDKAELKLTVRTYSDEVRTILLEGIERIAKGQAATFGAPEPDIKFERDYIPSTYNDPDLVKQSISAIATVIGEDNITIADPVMGGEDFAHYSRTADKIPSFIFWLGGVEPEKVTSGAPLPSLHSPLFAPDADATIETGVKAMTAAALAAFAET